MNPATPAAGTTLCRVEEIEQAKGFRFRTDDAVFYGVVLRQDERVWGFIDACPHTGQPLSLFGDRYFTRDERFLICAGHGAMFEPSNGECIAGPCLGRALRPWPVAVKDGVVVVA